MITKPTPADSAPQNTEDARELQARLYREIGIAAVAAALRFTTQSDPDEVKKEKHQDHAFLRGEHMAA